MNKITETDTVLTNEELIQIISKSFELIKMLATKSDDPTISTISFNMLDELKKITSYLLKGHRKLRLLE